MRLAPFTSKLVLGSILGAAAVGSGYALGHGGTASAASSPPVAAAAAAPLDTVALVDKVKSSVVNITVEQAAKAPASFDGSPFEFFFRGMPGAPRGEGGGMAMPKQRALGSGFIFDDKGHVLTNAHVIDGAERVRVKLADERELEAKVKGRDERLDVAVLEIQGAKDLPFVTLGSSAAVKVGEPVVAIGNPFGLGHTVTKGIVSAKGRAIGAGPYDDFLQTDASINPGNSGGPLFDARGQVVGMNTAINPNGQGIGFAIPSDEIREVLPQLVSEGHVSRGRLGVQIQDVDPKIASAMNLGAPHGALVGDVEKGSPADRAGLHAGDVIVRVDGADVPHARDLSRAVARHAPGAKVDVVVERAGKTVTVPVTLGKLDDEAKAERGSGGEAAPEPGSLGLAVGDAEGGGAVVRRVAPGSPAAGALRPGDVIVEVDRKPVKSAADLKARTREAPADKPLLFRVKRDDATHYVAVERK